MANTVHKSTPLGRITLDITLEGEAPTIPDSEVRELILILRDTAESLEKAISWVTRHQHPAKYFMTMDAGPKIH